LQNPDTVPGERLAALQFLLNLVGDVNDPLLAIDKGDQGGRCTAVQVGNKPPVRLASYWGTTLVGDVVGHDPAAGAARLLSSVSPTDMQGWAAGNPESWAMESYEVAKSIAYGFPADSAAGKAPSGGKSEADGCAEVALYKVGADYETKALAAVKQQLAKGGLRLAQVLRDSFK
jgi:nuclease S1